SIRSPVGTPSSDCAVLRIGLLANLDVTLVFDAQLFASDVVRNLLRYLGDALPNANFFVDDGLFLDRDLLLAHRDADRFRFGCIDRLVRRASVDDLADRAERNVVLVRSEKPR